ncbi:MAG: hypothetical protein JOZ19_08325 [Rubrobacter sp.]|nr:hypothetical protein [Rubrobacter sp.]
MAHHSIFRVIKGYDGELMWLNSLFLMCIAFSCPSPPLCSASIRPSSW